MKKNKEGVEQKCWWIGVRGEIGDNKRAKRTRQKNRKWSEIIEWGRLGNESVYSLSLARKRINVIGVMNVRNELYYEHHLKNIGNRSGGQNLII